MNHDFVKKGALFRVGVVTAVLSAVMLLVAGDSAVSAANKKGTIKRNIQRDIKPVEEEKDFPHQLISTEGLIMTGLRFPRQSVSASPLQMTGLRSSGQVVQAATLRMTGLRFPHQSVETESLLMTGLKESGRRKVIPSGKRERR